MRAELTKGQVNMVFVWGISSDITDPYVIVYTYEDSHQISRDAYHIDFARHLWDMMLTKGFHLLPINVPETLL